MSDDLQEQRDEVSCHDNKNFFEKCHTGDSMLGAVLSALLQLGDTFISFRFVSICICCYVGHKNKQINI